MTKHTVARIEKEAAQPYRASVWDVTVDGKKVGTLQRSPCSPLPKKIQSACHICFGRWYQVQRKIEKFLKMQLSRNASQEASRGD